MKHVESKLFNQNGHFYFSFQICITCTYLTNIFGYIYIYVKIIYSSSQLMNLKEKSTKSKSSCILHFIVVTHQG